MYSIYAKFSLPLPKCSLTSPGLAVCHLLPIAFVLPCIN